MATVDVLRDMADTVVNLLKGGIPSSIVAASNIVVATPDDFQPLTHPTQPTVTVFLYRIGVNPDLRNAPRRVRSDGKTTRQLLPLELSFLITAWANDTKSELLVIGRILQILYDHAELGAADLSGSSWESDDTVELVLESLPLEDHYRIWDATQIPYHLSLTYLARVIGIAPSEVVAPAPVIHALIGGAPP